MTNPFHHIGPFLGDQAVQRESIVESVCKYLLRQEYVALLAPRQSGKTSFLAQLEAHLVEQSRKICRLDLKTIEDSSLLVELFAYAVQQGSEKNSMVLLELFNNTCGAILFLIDELPRDVPVATSLLSSVRAYFNEAKARNLKEDAMHLFVFAGSVDLAFLAVGPLSPFNIAQEVYLPDFTLEETRSLIQNLVANENKTAVFDTPTIDLIYELTCGHPYLTQYLCYRIYDAPQDLDKILEGPENAIRLCGIEDSVNVQSMVDSLWSGKDTQEELRLLRFVLEGRSVRFMPSVRALKNLQLQGCIKNNEGWCAIRNPIYEMIFKYRFSMQDAVGMGLAGATETTSSRNVIPDRNTRSARIAQFHGKIQIVIIGEKGKVPFRTSAKKQIKDGFFTVHWAQDYTLVFKLIELAEAEKSSPELPKTEFGEDLVVEGADLSSQWVRYSVVPESFAIEFSAGEVGQTFAPRQQGELISGEYLFRFRTPSPAELSSTAPSQEPRDEEAHIYLSLYQETALVQVTAIKLLLVP